MWTHQSIEYVTVAGEAWLASASEYPRSMRALWESQPWAPTVLPCGRTFDIVNLPGLFGRRVLDELWESGPGCGPVATHRGRILVFAEVGTAARLRGQNGRTRTRPPARPTPPLRHRAHPAHRVPQPPAGICRGGYAAPAAPVRRSTLPTLPPRAPR